MRVHYFNLCCIGPCCPVFLFGTGDRKYGPEYASVLAGPITCLVPVVCGTGARKSWAVPVVVLQSFVDICTLHRALSASARYFKQVANNFLGTRSVNDF